MVSQFQLRAISVFGICLVTIWALSPIGGQASLRQISIGLKNTTALATFYHLAYNGSVSSFQNSGQETIWEVVNNIFTSAMVGSVASNISPVDVWGNVKTPRIEHDEAHTEADADGCFMTISDNAETYSFVIGTPMSRMNSTLFVNHRTRIQSVYCGHMQTHRGRHRVWRTSSLTIRTGGVHRTRGEDYAGQHYTDASTM